MGQGGRCRAAEIAADNRVLARGGMNHRSIPARVAGARRRIGAGAFIALAMASPSWLIARNHPAVADPVAHGCSGDRRLPGIAHGTCCGLDAGLVRPVSLEFPAVGGAPAGSTSPAMAAPQSDLPPAFPAPSSIASETSAGVVPCRDVLPKIIQPVRNRGGRGRYGIGRVASTDQLQSARR